MHSRKFARRSVKKTGCRAENCRKCANITWQRASGGTCAVQHGNCRWSRFPPRHLSCSGLGADGSQSVTASGGKIATFPPLARSSLICFVFSTSCATLPVTHCWFCRVNGSVLARCAARVSVCVVLTSDLVSLCVAASLHRHRGGVGQGQRHTHQR